MSYAWAEYYATVENNMEKRATFLEKALAQGLGSRTELRSAYETLLPRYVVSRDRARADAAYAGRIALDPKDALVRDGYARGLAVYFQDFEQSERIAREAIAIADFPHARQTLSLALYGQWAVAARDGKGPEVVDALYRNAQAQDPGGRMLPTCLADWQPLDFVYARLAQKNIRKQDMHRC